MRLLNWGDWRFCGSCAPFARPEDRRLVIVTREADAREVLRNPDVFNVPFGRG